MAQSLAVSKSKTLKKPWNIGIILYDGVCALDFMGPCQYFDTLCCIYGVHIEIYTIAPKVGPYYSLKTTGVPFYANQSYKDILQKNIRLDVLLVPGAPPTFIDSLLQNAEYMKFIRNAAFQAEHVLCICSGARILAATTILNGRSATTNKFLYHYVIQGYENVNWKCRARYVKDGKIWTSSGISAGMDATWAFIADIFGHKIADAAAVFLEIVPSREADSDPFYPTKKIVKQWESIQKNSVVELVKPNLAWTQALIDDSSELESLHAKSSKNAQHSERTE